ncbi:MAG: hypothetical protein MRY49_00545 [Candidatus Pacebacteria bacterium]|nr:hypothetical protein [Candidatus Paceibacterota bacterium]
MEKFKFNKINTIVIATFVIIVFILTLYSSDNSKSYITSNKETTIAECVALSDEVRINRRTKECFDNLSPEEFMSLLDSEEDMKLYEDVNAHYDDRTEAQKAKDARETEEFFDKIIQDNPDIFSN